MSEPTATGAKGLVKEELKIPGRCFIQFRPHSDYKGEFGFDWLREKDNGLNTEPDYETTIESGYKSDVSDYTKDEAYEALKDEYKTVSVMGFGRYYVSYLNLFSKTYSDSISDKISPKPPYEATLRILIEIRYADVDEIKFQFNKNIFSINDKEEYSLPLKTVCPLKLDQNIKITCKKDITNDKDGEILVYAYPKPKEGESQTPKYRENNKKLAGKIIVGKNDATVRKEAKFVMVCIQTAMQGIGKEKEGEWKDYEVEKIRNIFYQALVRPLIWLRYRGSSGVYKNITLDLTLDPDFLPGGKYVDATGSIKVTNGTMLTMIKDITSKFRAIPANSQYKDCIPVYIMGEPFSGAGGFTDADFDLFGDIKNFVKQSVSFFPRNKETIPHEIMHGFELFHTHRDSSPVKYKNIKYIYPHAHINPAQATDNIMSYQTDRYTTWHWQWEIIRSNL